MKPDFAALAKLICSFCKRRSPEILTGLGIAGMGAAVVLAAKATPKAQKAVREESKKVHDGDEHAYTKKEAIKWGFKYYAPSLIHFGVSSGCIIGASHTSLRRNAELAAAYGVTKTALKEYKETAKEVLGEKKEQALEDKIAEKRVEKQPLSSNPSLILDGSKTIVYDPWSGRYFNYDIESIKRAIEDISYALRDEQYMSLNEFYDLIGQERTKAGEILMWSADHGPLRPNFTSTLKDSSTPCLVIGFNRDPIDMTDLY